MSFTQVQGLFWSHATTSVSASLTLSLPGNAIGSPRLIEISSLGSGYAEIPLTNSQVLDAPFSANVITQVAVPAQAFPNKVSSVSVTVNLAAGAATTCLVGWTV